MGAMLFILSFATINVMIGGLFSPEVLAGEPIDPWIARIQAQPQIAQLGILASAVGFTFLFVFGFSLYRLVPKDDWRRTFAMSGYLLAAPAVVGAYPAMASLIKLTAAAPIGGFSEAMTAAVELQLMAFMQGNFGFGPGLIIICGHGGMAWAALRAGALPRWLCYWALINAALMTVGVLGLVWPALLVFQYTAPLSMLWMGTTGAYLLRSSWRTGADAH